MHHTFFIIAVLYITPSSPLRSCLNNTLLLILELFHEKKIRYTESIVQSWYRIVSVCNGDQLDELEVEKCEGAKCTDELELLLKSTSTYVMDVLSWMYYQ